MVVTVRVFVPFYGWPDMRFIARPLKAFFAETVSLKNVVIGTLTGIPVSLVLFVIWAYIYQ